ncbi:MAG: plasmid stabilization protein [Sulfurimonas sp.]|nr:MAG: plasmid stabilization protein [Sulfurimonas sp.]
MLTQRIKLQIVYNPTFIRNFNVIWDYISDSSINSANKFKSHLKVKIESIPNFSYKSRKSFYYEAENVRDYIFKGYTIPYLIDNDKNKIVILDIFKWINKRAK